MCFNSFWKQYRIIKNNLNLWLYLNKQVYLMQQTQSFEFIKHTNFQDAWLSYL